MFTALHGVNGLSTELPPMTDAALIIFTRNPELGKCKTRLAATIGDENALEVYKFLIRHTAQVTKNLPFDCFVYYSQQVHKDDYWDDTSYKKAVQTDGDLGLKMQTAFTELFAKGYKYVAIIGSDLFDIRSEDLLSGMDKLKTHDAVIGPAHDGGYYFLGLKEELPQLFQNKNWGSDTVLEDTLSNLTNKSVASLPIRNDIDYFEDIKDKVEFKPFIPQHLL